MVRKDLSDKVNLNGDMKEVRSKLSGYLGEEQRGDHSCWCVENSPGMGTHGGGGTR